MICFRRLYHVSNINYSFKKQGVKLCKMVNPGSKKQWYPVPAYDEGMPSLKSLTKTKFEPGKRGLRRTAMLNKMFMKQITDLMSTGTVSMDVVGRGIEISKVNVSPDFKTVNVFWICKGTSSDEETEAILNKTAGPLRHELSTLRIMGEIPYIVFVKDKQEALITELHQRLSVADYGEDYVLTEEGHLLKSEFVLNTTLSPEVKAKIRQLEEDLEITEEPIPEMTNNVFGLDHSKIMNRLLAARKKSRDAWTHLDSENDVISYRASNDESSVPAVSSQKKELAEFLLQRQILHKKIAKQLKDTRDSVQLVDTEDSEYNPREYYYEDIDDLEEGEEDDDDEYYRADYTDIDNEIKLQELTKKND
ncbi:putative ribosome-binding factor A, mitochondrial [Anticarsia gemmatalis]|uniref:putative ribosome-binding factor A, mitochondrial n=1 Tax=Anticarsia gemmatalis TaxID=129554 RepID=UPI003F75CE79